MGVFEQKRASFVYVIEDAGGMTKVGVSTDPESRLLTLQTANPSRISIHFTLPCINSRLAYKIENKAHSILLDQKANGEWFSCGASKAVSAVVQAALEVAADDFGFVTVRDEDVGISRRAARIIAERCRASGLRKGEVISEAVEAYYVIDRTAGNIIPLSKRSEKDADPSRLLRLAQKIIDASVNPISWSSLVRKAGVSKVADDELRSTVDRLEKSGAIKISRRGRGLVIQSIQPDEVAA